MAENLGPTQPFSHETKDYSWDYVVFQQSRSPRTADWDLVGQAASQKMQLSQVGTSGWSVSGPIVQSTSADLATIEGSAVDGQVIASEAYQADTFKLVSKGGLRAMVNGWALDIRGKASDNGFNIIQLDSMVGHSSGRLDIVFLEVWKELITKDDTIYKYGNVDSDELVNDLSSANRVQIKYRIRTSIGPVPGTVDIHGSPDGFGPGVYASGALSKGLYTTYTFVNQTSAGDPGLWRAGDGSSAAQTSLGTVDGYSYAIPMFAVYRRGYSAGFQPNSIDSSVSLKGSGLKSDRPDGFYVDSVYSEDFVDLRHQPITGNDLSASIEKTWKSLIAGTLTTRKGLTRSNSGYVDMPGGSITIKGEEFGANATGLPYLGNMLSSGSAAQRTLCSAEVLTKNNVVDYYPGTAWTAQTYYVYMGANGYVFVSMPTGAYTATSMTTLVEGVDLDYSLPVDQSVLYVTIPVGSSLIGTTEHIKIQLDVTYLKGNRGLMDVPSELLEIRATSSDPSVQRAMPAVDGQTIKVPGDLASSSDFIAHRGAEYAATWDQGINVVSHLTMPSASAVAITLADGLIHGHEVVGIKGIQRETSPGVYGAWQSFEVMRSTVPSGIEYQVSSISTINGENSTNVRITYLSKTKFFEVSRQGRGITETYEASEVTPLYIGGVFYVDTGSYPLLAIGQAAYTQGAGTQGLPYAYVNGQKRLLVTTTDGGLPLVNRLPVIGSANYVVGKYLPTRCKIEFQGAAVLPTDVITVPVITHSKVTLPESFTVYYKTTGYQGTSSSISKTGTIMATGSHIATSCGSAEVGDYVVTGTARFGMLTDKRVVDAETGTDWDGLVNAGDYIAKQSEPYERYRIASVVSGTQLILEEQYFGASESVAFTVVRKDVPQNGSYCIIDRLPSASACGWKSKASHNVSLGSPSAEGLRVSTVADPLAAEKDDTVLGSVAQVFHGRTGLLVSRSGSKYFQRPVQFVDAIYGELSSSSNQIRLYQSYLFAESGTGRVFMAVLAGETSPDNFLVRFTGGKGVDAVDVYEVLGRPLIGRG